MINTLPDVSQNFKRHTEMLKFLFGLIFFFSINLINAQNEIEYVKKELISENNYMIIRSLTNYHKLSNAISYVKTDTTFMHFFNDTVIYNNNQDSIFRLSTNKYFYSIYDSDSLVSFRIIDSTYIWGWNFSVIFDFMKNGLNNVTHVEDTLNFILNKNIYGISKVRYYKDDLLHLDFFEDTEYGIAIHSVSLMPTDKLLQPHILDRIKRINFVNDSLVFSNTCSGYLIDCYNMKQVPTKHYVYKIQ
jgi:hypothetical protein